MLFPLRLTPGRPPKQDCSRELRWRLNEGDVTLPSPWVSPEPLFISSLTFIRLRTTLSLRWVARNKYFFPPRQCCVAAQADIQNSQLVRPRRPVRKMQASPESPLTPYLQDRGFPRTPGKESELEDMQVRDTRCLGTMLCLNGRKSVTGSHSICCPLFQPLPWPYPGLDAIHISVTGWPKYVTSLWSQ